MNDIDPEAYVNYSGSVEGKGAKFTWKGNKDVGEGVREIVESVQGESLRTRIDFNGWDAISFGQWNFEESDNKTTVSWTFEGGDTAFPFRPFNVLMKAGFKKTYKNGLAKLKSIAELRAKDKVYRGHKINELILDKKHYLINRQEVKLENIQQFYATNLGALFMKVQNGNLQMEGMPSGLFFSPDNNSDLIDMAAAIPISEAKNVEGAQLLTLESGRALQINFYGDYSGTTEAHTAMSDYLKDYGLFKKVPVIEEYVTDPGVEKDPSKWLTKISYYISEN